MVVAGDVACSRFCDYRVTAFGSQSTAILGGFCCSGNQHFKCLNSLNVLQMKLRHRLVYATFLGAACCAASSGILLLNESASAPGDIAGGETMVNNELDEHSTEKFGTITAGYTLVEEPPDCYTKLGSAYCPGPG